MDTMALLGIVAIIYAALVFWMTAKKPQQLWGIAKVQFFIKILGEKGTEIFFYIWGLAFLVLGIWLFVK